MIKMYAITACLCLFYIGCTPSSDAVVQNLYWREYIPGDIPCDAIKGATARYIGQINYKGHILPATIYPHNHKAISNYGNKLIIKDDIKILCSGEIDRIYWANVDFEKPHDQQMEGAIKGGYDDGFIIYIGSHYEDNEWKIGKVLAIDETEKGLYVWNDSGREIRFLKFLLLKYNSTLLASDDAGYQNFYWRDYIPGIIPYDALKAAPGRYIGQINFQGHFLPATIYPQTNIAIGSFGRKIPVTKNIKILCTPYPEKFYWEQVNFNLIQNQQMQNAVKGGFQYTDAASGTMDMYIGKLYRDEEWKISKVVGIDDIPKGFFVWNLSGDSEVRLYEFYLLKYNSNVTHCF